MKFLYIVENTEQDYGWLEAIFETEAEAQRYCVEQDLDTRFEIHKAPVGQSIRNYKCESVAREEK